MHEALIHARANKWQPRFAGLFREGLRRLGIASRVTSSDEPSELDILLGTSYWRRTEALSPRWLLVDRCQFGDADNWVSLCWNGHGLRGDHRVPEGHDASRWERYGRALKPYRVGNRFVVCGQTESYSPHWGAPDDWYRHLGSVIDFDFRPHPALGDRLNGHRIRTDWDDCRAAIVLNSSVGVQCLLDGIPVVTMDEGSMAWPITGHIPHDVRYPDREEWCHWLAWCQWTADEISEGRPWAHLWA